MTEWSQEVLALTRRWYLILFRERLNLVFSVAQPAIWLVFFGTALGRAIDPKVVGAADYTAYMVPGIIAFTVVGNGVAAAMPLLFDKETGYLDKLMSMPIQRSSLITSRFLFMLGLNSAQAIVVLLVAVALGVTPAAGILGVIVILLAAALLTLAVTAAFVALAYAVRGHGTFFAISGFITLPLLFISNAFVPVDVMPGWMAVVARVNPLTYAIDAMRVLTLDGWRVGVTTAMGGLLIAAAICLAAGTWQFRKQTAERLA